MSIKARLMTIDTRQTPAIEGLSIRVRGQVQGVGFRPAVWKLATDCQLKGHVLNDGEGVSITAWGEPGMLRTFLTRLQNEAPPLSRIQSIETTRLSHEVVSNFSGDISGDLTASPPLLEEQSEFTILHSLHSYIETDITPDTATCAECLSEINSSTDHRYQYPFTNCTHCGPRLSIIRALPYDRANTTMQPFPMCDHCREEYNNPNDRRFHAQPNACPVCGPQIWLEDTDGNRLKTEYSDEVISKAAKLIRSGAIIAIKGIGGFHLACDALNEKAVAELRHRKLRYDKPFALMVKDPEMAARISPLSLTEKETLAHRAAPIVIVKKLSTEVENNPDLILAPSIAPDQNNLGIMLPYTPLHHCLLKELDQPIVLTSGNASHAPQVIKNEDAQQKLRSIADYLLTHDREIINRLDDSVAMEMAGKMTIVRRARGYAPAPLALPPGFKGHAEILAMGAELKNSFCLLNNGKATLSQHIGDLENPISHEDYRSNIELYLELFAFTPRTIAIDHHPNYLSTKWGEHLAATYNAKLEKVQHHHAHIAACMAENGIPRETENILGIALDGLGLSENGELWGSEFLLADYQHYKRLAHFAPIPLIGGEKAMKEPWRNAYACLSTTGEWEKIAAEYHQLEVIRFLKSRPLSQIKTMLAKNMNTPPSTSAGRIFDAVAAMLNIRPDQISYEGQAAIELEALAEHQPYEQKQYRFTLRGHEPLMIDWHLAWKDLLADLKSGTAKSTIARRFHNTVIDAIVNTTTILAKKHRFKKVALTGGVFQNRILLQGVLLRLEAKNFTVLHHQHIPANDGGLSLGQAIITAARSCQ